MKNTTSDWEYRIPDEYGWAVCYLGVHQGGDVVFMAEGTKDTSVTEWASAHDGNMDGFDWNSVNWTISAEPVTVNVIYYGDLEDPEVTIHNANNTVERGEALVFTIALVDNSNYYGYRIRKVLENGESDNIVDSDVYMTETTSIRILTDDMTAGTYRLYVDARCYGWHGNEVGVEFTVTETSPWANKAVLILPAWLTTIEEEAFAGVAARKIVVPAGVTTIEARAFANCRNLVQIELPEGITSFAENAFDGCGQVTVYGFAGSDQQAYATYVDNLVFVLTE